MSVYARALVARADYGWLLAGDGGVNPTSHQPHVGVGGEDLNPTTDVKMSRFGPRFRALRMAASGAIVTDGTRPALTTTASCGIWFRTRSTDASSGYDGNPALGLFGDYTNGVWFQFGIHGGKLRYTRFHNPAWQTVDSNKSVNDWRWRFGGFTYDGAGALKIFVDGVVDKSQSITHSNGGGLNTVGAGYLNGTGNQDAFDGDLWGPFISTSCLADSVMRDLYVAGRRDLECV